MGQKQLISLVENRGTELLRRQVNRTGAPNRPMR